jgi:hypothetical protein
MLGLRVDCNYHFRTNGYSTRSWMMWYTTENRV